MACKHLESWTLVLLLVLAIAPAGAASLPESDGAMHNGVESCASGVCHGSSTERDATSVLQNEYITWSQADPHAGAYEVLLGDASRRIAEHLGIGAPEQAAQCLACHADNVPAERRGADFALTDGVTCEACHGGSEGWLESHAEGQDHARNVEAGMYPLADRGARAELCLSCHLGTDDKFATHEMMSAGHPRLSFELNTFESLQPPHWLYDADYVERKGEMDGFDIWAGGLLTAARQTVALLEGPRFHESGLFPEIALFDCHSCHHAMNDLRWQPTVATVGMGPGAVRLNDANLVLLLPLAGAVDAALGQRLLRQVQQLNASVAGGRGAVRRAAADTQRLLDELESALAGDIDQAGRARVLRGLLASAADGEYRDYVAAEQAAMAMDVILTSLGRWEASKAQVDAVFATVADDEAYSAERFAAAARALQQTL